ncbi:molybdenum cofactor biosynthesis protein MoaE [Luteimonas granuli]|uniref:Molybdopterin synthase catalytic subunit n=1 Tax=Luteimonas granuli TaxID=1176533 RepID=A0A518N207_9GAMM|nr:molybdenum cofactor biosynthesis protein MoaE [Luteimonas granuli]QDW65961.1 molybdenum cofactor biosynthesis protein MoaE [Luteimonas granuli]
MERFHCAVTDVAEGPLDPAAAMGFVSDPGFGGMTMFVGRVRDLNHGRVVTGVSYDMFEPLALNGFRDICEDMDTRFGPKVKLYVAHAKGRLGVGDLAVVIAAGTPHRDEAFRACRELIERVKHTSPIWKQEHYEDGDSVWSEGCSLCGVDEAGQNEAAVADGSHDHSHDGHSHGHAGGRASDAEQRSAPGTR